MTPISSALDRYYRHSIDVESSGDFAGCDRSLDSSAGSHERNEFSDLFNILRCQLCTSMLFATWAALWMRYGTVSFSNCLAALCNHVMTVISKRAEKHMAWIGAWAIVAFVQAVGWSWINPVRQQIRNSVSLERFLVYVKDAVSHYARTQPEPTFIWSAFVYLTPKSRFVFFGKFGNWFRIVSSHLISFVDRWSEPGERSRAPWLDLFNSTLILPEVC